MVKDTLIFIVDELKSKDRLGLILFDDKVDVLRSLTKMTEKNKKDFKKAIENIRVRGSTNIGMAINVALNELLKRKKCNEVS